MQKLIQTELANNNLNEAIIFLLWYFQETEYDHCKAKYEQIIIISARYNEYIDNQQTLSAQEKTTERNKLIKSLLIFITHIQCPGCKHYRKPETHKQRMKIVKKYLSKSFKKLYNTELKKQTDSSLRETIELLLSF
jgi:hypothetical protein